MIVFHSQNWIKYGYFASEGCSDVSRPKYVAIALHLLLAWFLALPYFYPNFCYTYLDWLRSLPDDINWHYHALIGLLLEIETIHSLIWRRENAEFTQVFALYPRHTLRLHSCLPYGSRNRENKQLWLELLMKSCQAESVDLIFTVKYIVFS